MNRTAASRWSVDFRYHAAPAALNGRPRAALEDLHDRLRASGREPLPVLSETATPTWRSGGRHRSGARADGVRRSLTGRGSCRVR